MTRLLLAFFSLIALPLAAQRLTHWNQKGIPDNQVFLSYENDFFTHRDQYYSQGITLGYKHVLKPDSGLVNLPKNTRTVGFVAEHQVFTPSTIRLNSPLPGDHPYAALVRASFLFETRNQAIKFDMGYSASVGMMGPQALGKEMQTAVHKATDNPKPLGWQYQLPNSLLIDFACYAKKQLFYFRKSFTLDGFGQTNIGTTNIDLSTGLQLRYVFPLNKTILSFYGNPAVRFVGYDGTLQGALFAKDGEVSIPAADIRRVVSEQEVGIQFITKKWKISHWYHFQSRGFNHASAHSWGGFAVAYAFEN